MRTPSPLLLYRVTRAGRDGLFPPASGTGRFDVPDRSFRTLYTALEREAAFAETLQQFRPSLEVRSDLAALRFAEVTNPPISLRTWAAGRVMLRLRLPASANVLDLRGADGLEQATSAVAGQMRTLGLADFDAGSLLSPDRRVTQIISAWAFAYGFDALLVPSRLGSDWTNCVVFDRIRPRVVSREPISVTDPDLQHVAARFGIRITG